MSQVNTNAIYDASGGQSAKLYGPSMRYGGTAFVNRIINGEMRIDQRNAGASVTITNTSQITYTLDRFNAYGTVASKFSVQQNAGAVTPPAGFTNYLGVTSLSTYAITSTDRFVVQYRGEGYNTADLAWGTASAVPVTVSFWVRSSIAGSFGGSLMNGSVNRSYPFLYSVSTPNTWELKTITVPGDTTGTWGTGNGEGVRLTFGLGNGSTESAAAGSWVSGFFLSATGATSVVGTSGATFYITGVQLEAGSVASPFERRDYGRELMMCQRYYEKSFAQGVAPSNGPSVGFLGTEVGSVVGVAQNRVGAGPTVFFKATKRALPTISKYGNINSDWVYALQESLSWIGNSNAGIARVSDASFTVYQQIQDAIAIFIKGHWVASAEL